MDKIKNQKKHRWIRKELEYFGFSQHFAVRNGPYMFLIFIVLLSLSFELFFKSLPFGMNGSRASTIVLTLGALLLGYQQWRAARNELSMERYYERLDLADRRLDNWPSARDMVKHFWPTAIDQASYECSMYVYVELDNLEYVIEKYKLGYISPEQALRGLRTFQSRCISTEFRELAQEYVKLAGYQSTTEEIVNNVCKDLFSQSLDK